MGVGKVRDAMESSLMDATKSSEPSAVSVSLWADSERKRLNSGTMSGRSSLCASLTRVPDGMVEDGSGVVLAVGRGRLSAGWGGGQKRERRRVWIGKYIRRAA